MEILQTIETMMNETQNTIRLTLIVGVNDNPNLGNAILNNNPTETNRSKSFKIV